MLFPEFHLRSTPHRSSPSFASRANYGALGTSTRGDRRVIWKRNVLHYSLSSPSFSLSLWLSLSLSVLLSFFPVFLSCRPSLSFFSLYFSLFSFFSSHLPFPVPACLPRRTQQFTLTMKTKNTKEASSPFKRTLFHWRNLRSRPSVQELPSGTQAHVWKRTMYFTSLLNATASV